MYTNVQVQLFSWKPPPICTSYYRQQKYFANSLKDLSQWFLFTLNLQASSRIVPVIFRNTLVNCYDLHLIFFYTFRFEKISMLHYCLRYLKLLIKVYILWMIFKILTFDWVCEYSDQRGQRRHVFSHLFVKLDSGFWC